MQVDTAAGVWKVHRRWAPRHLGSQTIWARFLHRSRKVRRRTIDVADRADPGCSVDFAEGIVVFIFAVVLIAFLVLFGIPFLFALGELVLILVLAFAGVLGRVLFRRPWTIDAVSPTGMHYDWSVVGWKPSGLAVQFVADRIANTEAVPTEADVATAVQSE